MAKLSCTFFFCADAQGDRNWSHDEIGQLERTVLKGWQFLKRGKNTLAIFFNPEIVPRLWRGKFDLVVIGGWGQPTMIMAILTCWLTHTRYWIHSESHGQKQRTPWKKILRKIFPGLLIRGASGFLATGKWSKLYLRAFGVPEKRIFVFPNTVDTAAYQQESGRLLKKKSHLREELQLPGLHNFLFVGRLVQTKGILDLLAAFENLGAEGAEWGLVIVGDGLLRNEITSRLRQKSRRDHILLLPHMSPQALLKYYTASDVFVLPSHDEPWGVVVNEAMACGLPVILSDQVGAAGDLLDEGNNGFGFPAKSNEALAQAMRRFCSEPELCRKMSRRSLDIVEDWGYERNLRGFKDALQHCAGFMVE